MFGFLKNLVPKRFSRQGETHEAEEAASDPIAAALYAKPATATPAASAAPSAGANGGPPQMNGGQNAKGIELPLQPILSSLPVELQPRLTQIDVGAATIYIPLEKILSQLSRGAVKIAFGELRAAAPDLFS